MTIDSSSIGKLVRVKDCPAGAVLLGHQGEKYVIGSTDANVWVRSLRKNSERVLLSLPAPVVSHVLDPHQTLDLPALRRGHNQDLPVGVGPIVNRDVKPEFQSVPEQCRLQLCLCYSDDVCQKCGALAREHSTWKPAPGMDRKRPDPETPEHELTYNSPSDSTAPLNAPRTPVLTYDAIPEPAVPLAVRVTSMMEVIRAADIMRDNQGFRLGSHAHQEALRNYDEKRAKLKLEEP